MGCNQSLDVVESHNKPTDLPIVLPKQLKYHVDEIECSIIATVNSEKPKLVSERTVEVKSEPIRQTSQQIPQQIHQQIPQQTQSLKRSPPSFIARTIRSFSVASTDSYRTSVYTGHYYDVTSGLSNVELINTINWIEEYKPNIKEFKILKEDAMMEYKEKIRNQLSGYFTNINLKHDFGVAIDKTMFTSIPEDHFAMIQTCVNVVKTNLDSSHVKEIVIMAIQLLRDELRILYDRLASEQFETNILCAFVNDYLRMKILCGNLNEEIYTYESDEITNELFDMLISEIPNDYDRIVGQLLELIVKNILADLHKVFFSKLFTHEWETSPLDANVLVATLKDHFSDILVWLNSSQHNKIIEMLMNETLSQYIFGLENRSNKKFTNKVSAIAKVSRDKTLMKAYFSRLHPPANEFDILDNICKLILSKK